MEEVTLKCLYRSDGRERRTQFLVDKPIW